MDDQRNNFPQSYKKILEATNELGFNQLSDERIGSLLATLCASKVKGIFLELGTGTGLCTSWILQGMCESSKLITVDNEKPLVEVAKKYLGEDPRVEFVISDGEDLIEKLNETEKKVLKTLIQEHLGNIHEFELKTAIDSLKSFSEKAKEFWNKYFGAINMLVNGLSHSLNLQGVNMIKFDAYEKKLARPYKYRLEMFRDLCLKIGFESVYVLLDKVDESELTGNKAEDSFKMIQSMVRDLELLEMDKFGFKFFLWDQLGSHFREYSRPDRVEQFTLEWSNEELEQMLAQRLSAYSGGKITDLEQITTKFQEDITPLVILFAQKSPRDAIRICKQIIAEQREINSESTHIESKAILEGIENFCKIRALEITDEVKIRELRKIGFVEFTIPYLTNDVFKISRFRYGCYV